MYKTIIDIHIKSEKPKFVFTGRTPVRAGG
jgi:hypothetical protein